MFFPYCRWYSTETGGTSKSWILCSGKSILRTSKSKKLKTTRRLLRISYLRTILRFLSSISSLNFLKISLLHALCQLQSLNQPHVRTSQASLSSNPDADFRYSMIYTQVGAYKGRIFAVKKVKKKSIEITREMKKELKMVRMAIKN